MSSPVSMQSVYGQNTSSSYTNTSSSSSIQNYYTSAVGWEFTYFWTSYGQVISLFGTGLDAGFSTHTRNQINDKNEEKLRFAGSWVVPIHQDLENVDLPQSDESTYPGCLGDWWAKGGMRHAKPEK